MGPTEVQVAVKALYRCMRELTDSGLLDLAELRADAENGWLAGEVERALALGTAVLAEWPARCS